MEEIWKDIEGYEGIYKVSSFGNVMSLKRYGRKESKLLCIVTSKSGYAAVTLCIKQKCAICKVHQLVAYAFLGYKYDKNVDLVIDHIDNNPLNNRLNNLRLITNRENSSKDRPNKTSGHTGVTLDKRCNKWVSKIGYKDRTIVIGSFDIEELDNAISAYKNAVIDAESGIDLDKKYPKKEYTSKFKGVFFNTIHQKWQACIKFNGKTVCLGRFSNEIDAKNAVDEATRKIALGEFKARVKNEYEGISYFKKINKWGVTVVLDGKRTYIGSFKTKEDAYFSQMEYLNKYNSYVSIGN